MRVFQMPENIQEFLIPSPRYTQLWTFFKTLVILCNGP
jgi:hypothetical protein